MKILLIITSLGMGGAEQQVRNLADRFVMSGNKVTIISLTGSLIIKPCDLSVEIFQMNMKKTPWSFLNTYLKMRKIIRIIEPDVVHAHMFHANIMGRLLRLSIPIKKLVCTAHSSNEGGRVRMQLYNWTNFLANLNTNVSKVAVEDFIKKGAFKQGQIIAVPNGIDTERFSKKEELYLRKELHLTDEFLFITVGRLSDAKDHNNLLKAFKIVSKNNPRVRLAIVGMGEKENELKSLCKELNLEKKVFFLGLRKDIPNLLADADAFVLSSWYEGLPLVIGEAMACEKVVISTDCGGREFIDKYGFLVPIRNSKLLADKMQKVINLPKEDMQKIGAEARKHIENNYSIDVIAEKWLRIYN